MHAANLTPHGAGGVFHASLLFFLAFGGFDMVAAAGEEVENPERNLPTSDSRSPSGPCWSSTSQSQPGHRLGEATTGGVISLVALLTTAATANAVLIVTSRVTFAMRRTDLRDHLALNAILMAAVAASRADIALVTRVGGFLYALHFVAPLLALRSRSALLVLAASPRPRHGDRGALSDLMRNTR